MSRPLLDLAPDVSALLDLIDETDGELTVESEKALEAWWAEIGQERDEKLDGYCALVRSLELRAAVRKEEAERLAKRVSADSNTVRRLKDRMKLFMELTGTRKVQTRRYQITVCGNGGQTPMQIPEHVGLLPEEFQKVEYKPDADKIREQLEVNQMWEKWLARSVSERLVIPEPEGKERQLPGCKLLPRGSHVRIS